MLATALGLMNHHDFFEGETHKTPINETKKREDMGLPNICDYQNNELSLRTSSLDP